MLAPADSTLAPHAHAKDGEHGANCFEAPSSPECRTFVYRNASTDLDSLCGAMPFMPGCTVLDACRTHEHLKMKPYCEDFSLLADVCARDMPRMKGCKNYVAMCAPGSVIPQCTSNAALPHLPTTSETASIVRSICSEMDMPGCERCPATGMKGCGLELYADLCAAMPKMSQCETWGALCSAAADLPICPMAEGSTQPPAMKMFFHFGYSEYVLFEPVVPRNFVQYSLACLLIFSMAVFYEFLLWMKRVSARVVKKTSIVAGASASETEPLLRSSVGSALAKALTRLGKTGRALLRFVQVIIAYVLMLFAMTYNVGMFLSVAGGLAVGYYIFEEDPLQDDASPECCA